ncbi:MULTISPECIES: DUF982 domain-containing protein [Georhizobium]|jgi:hypothetical protein|nr:DUF982 domain-containing protein [Georhizobium profundi]
MASSSFDHTVHVFAGLGFIQAIKSPAAALSYLEAMPGWRKDKRHTAAHKACRAGMSGGAQTAAARAAFEDFMLHAGLLVQNSPQVDELTTAA